jgi:hypothetical protein
MRIERASGDLPNKISDGMAILLYEYDSVVFVNWHRSGCSGVPDNVEIDRDHVGQCNTFFEQLKYTAAMEHDTMVYL